MKHRDRNRIVSSVLDQPANCRIVIDPNTSALDCVVRNLSLNGALLLDHGNGVPSPGRAGSAGVPPIARELTEEFIAGKVEGVSVNGRAAALGRAETVERDPVPPVAG